MIAANAEAETGDEEGVTLSEFNRWLIHEDNWTSAEEVREHYQEGRSSAKRGTRPIASVEWSDRLSPSNK